MSKVQGKKAQWYVGGWSVPCSGEDTGIIQLQRELRQEMEAC